LQVLVEVKKILQSGFNYDEIKLFDHFRRYSVAKFAAKPRTKNRRNQNRRNLKNLKRNSFVSYRRRFSGACG